MNNVVRSNFREEPTAFTVDVTFDPDCSMWVGICDALHIVTEAPTFEALCERVGLVAEDAGHERLVD
jgi:hypothetical protein